MSDGGKTLSAGNALSATPTSTLMALGQLGPGGALRQHADAQVRSFSFCYPASGIWHLMIPGMAFWKKCGVPSVLLGDQRFKTPKEHVWSLVAEGSDCHSHLCINIVSAIQNGARLVKQRETEKDQKYSHLPFPPASYVGSPCTEGCTSRRSFCNVRT